jgi:hypothetical protein
MPSRYVFEATQTIPVRLRVKTTATRSGVWALVVNGDKVTQRDVWVDTLPVGQELIIEVTDDQLTIKPAGSDVPYTVLHEANTNGVDFEPPVPLYGVVRTKTYWSIDNRLEHQNTLWLSYDGLNYQPVAKNIMLDISTTSVWLYAEDQYHNRSLPVVVRIPTR